MKELIEIGFLDGFFAFDVQPLNALIWACVLAGFLIQYIVLKKGKRPYVKWIFPALLLAGIAVCEYLTWVIIGWDLLGVCIIYWGILCAAMGAGTAWVVYKLRKRRKDECS